MGEGAPVSGYDSSHGPENPKVSVWFIRKPPITKCYLRDPPKNPLICGMKWLEMTTEIVSDQNTMSGVEMTVPDTESSNKKKGYRKNSPLRNFHLNIAF